VTGTPTTNTVIGCDRCGTQVASPIVAPSRIERQAILRERLAREGWEWDGDTCICGHCPKVAREDADSEHTMTAEQERDLLARQRDRLLAQIRNGKPGTKLTWAQAYDLIHTAFITDPADEVNHRG
jgi:hypothetical protein